MRARDIARFLILVLMAACGGGAQSLTLSLNPVRIDADGMTVAEVSASVIFRDDPVSDGRRVIFRSNEALLYKTREEVLPSNGDAELFVSTAGGLARVFLLAPREQKEIRVEATFTTVNKEVLKDTVTIKVGKPPLVSAGRFASDPSQTQRQFGISCSSRNIGGVDNIGALSSNRDIIEMPCSLLLQDQAGRDLPHTPVRFFVEAGEIVDVPAEGNQPRQVTYVVVPSPVVLPRDVAPTAAETSRGFVDFDDTGRSINPRDGLVSILAVVRGNEAYDDLNGNGSYDVGEPFLDEGEPFLDVDDDGIYNPVVDPAPCCDSNGNLTVDGPNGQYDSNVWLGRMTHVLWTGPVDLSRSKVFPNGANIDPRSSVILKLRIVDGNYNPVAGGDADDEARFSVSPSGKVSFTPPEPFDASSAALQNTTGMVLRQYPDFIFGYLTPVFAGLLVDEPEELFRDWPIVITDERGPTSSSICDNVPWTFHVEVRATPAPGSPATTTELTASGVLEAKPQPCP